MSKGHVAVDGAISKCKFGDVPDVLVVQSQQKHYINDNASKKLIANTMDLGAPFKAKTFGQCKLQPTGSSFKPCMPVITQWQDFYDKVLLSNQGQILTEKSKATCAIAGSPCIEFTWHGQTAEGGSGPEEEADEEVQSQLNPLVNPNEQPAPVLELDGGPIDDEGNAIEQKKINVNIEAIKVTFVPLGIRDYNWNEENEYLKFNINIADNPADKMKVEVFKDGKSHYTEEIEDATMLSLGSHEWEWDGFGDYGDYNSKSFKEDEIAVVATVWLDGQEKSHRTVIEKKKPIGKDWVDVSISRNIKEITVYLKVNLRDGGWKGLETANSVPQAVVSYYKAQPIISPAKTFEDLRKLAIKGIDTYWSRNGSRSFKTKIKGDDWNITIKTTQDEGGMPAPKIIGLTNQKEGRSNNSIFSRQLFYNCGYVYDKDWKDSALTSDIYINRGWKFYNKNVSEKLYKVIAAHEIGHQILLAYGGVDYSAKHKGTSTIFSGEKKDTPFPIGSNVEIDIMKYSNDANAPSDYYFRVVASQKDVLSLIWLSKLKIKE